MRCRMNKLPQFCLDKTKDYFQCKLSCKGRFFSCRHSCKPSCNLPLPSLPCLFLPPLRPLACMASAAPACSQYHRPFSKSLPTARAPHNCARNCQLCAWRAPRYKAPHVQEGVNLGFLTETTTLQRASIVAGPELPPSPPERLLPRETADSQLPFNCPQAR